jgi:arylsulfatase A-like enzyme
MGFSGTTGVPPPGIRWPGVIRCGTVKKELFAALDWLPTFVEIAGGPKGDGLKKQIEAGQYPGIVKTTLDGVNQIDYLTGKSEKSARDYFFYYSGSTPSASIKEQHLDYRAKNVPLPVQP